MFEEGAALLAEADRRLGPAQVASARLAAPNGFAGGSAWLSQVMSRENRLSAGRSRYLGVVKYGLTSAAFGLVFVTTFSLFGPAAALPAALAFYVAEAQLVFLFPVAIDGHPRPFREARRLTRAAGGTLVVVARVLPLAATMLFGGPFRGGAIRAWALGCMAVVVWYEQLSPPVSAGPREP